MAAADLGVLFCLEFLNQPTVAAALVLRHDAQLSPAAADLLSSGAAPRAHHTMPCGYLRLGGRLSIRTAQSRYVVAARLMSTVVVKRGADLPRRLDRGCAEASSIGMFLRRLDMEVVQQSSMRREAAGMSACWLVLAADSYNAVLDRSQCEEAAVRQAC